MKQWYQSKNLFLCLTSDGICIVSVLFVLWARQKQRNIKQYHGRHFDTIALDNRSPMYLYLLKWLVSNNE